MVVIGGGVDDVMIGIPNTRSIGTKGKVGDTFEEQPRHEDDRDQFAGKRSFVRVEFRLLFSYERLGTI